MRYLFNPETIYEPTINIHFFIDLTWRIFKFCHACLAPFFLPKKKKQISFPSLYKILSFDI